ncbi:MAG: CBS domain-containing protein [Candidatus Thermoplasmatota archaeon]|nr:CBS domain-containing protein [Candidatus Thermoplasmatota archaeon]
MSEELKKIKKMRQKLGITQSELAKLAGVSQSIITKIENTKIEPSYSIARKILITLEQEIAGKHDQIKAKDVCSKKIISIQADQTIDKALNLMVKNAISQMPVFKENVLVGSVSEELFIKKYDKIKNKNVKIQNIMDETLPTIPEDTNITLVNEILKIYPAILVVKNGKTIGIISKTDILQKYPL